MLSLWRGVTSSCTSKQHCKYSTVVCFSHDAVRFFFYRYTHKYVRRAAFCFVSLVGFNLFYSCSIYCAACIEPTTTGLPVPEAASIRTCINREDDPNKRSSVSMSDLPKILLISVRNKEQLFRL